MSVIIEFEEGCHETGFQMAGDVLQKEKRSKLKSRFNKINCCSAEVTPSALHSLLSECSNIRKVYLNREVKALLDTATEASHAKEVVRNGQTLTGKGVTVAVVDTGIYPHPDLEGRIIGFADMVNQKQSRTMIMVMAHTVQVMSQAAAHPLPVNTADLHRKPISSA